MLIKLDKNNFNKHTEKGMELLERSVEEVGVIESITVDAEGEIITGNARKEVFDKKGLKPKFVELASDEYPVIQTQLSGEKRVKAALYANTVAKNNLNFDEVKIQEVAVEEFNIDIETVGVSIIPLFEGNLNDFFAEDEPKEKTKKKMKCPCCSCDFEL